jgi:hypothetical protein
MKGQSMDEKYSGGLGKIIIIFVIILIALLALKFLGM